MVQSEHNHYKNVPNCGGQTAGEVKFQQDSDQKSKNEEAGEQTPRQNKKPWEWEQHDTTT